MKKTLLTMFENGTLHLLVLVVTLAVVFALSGCVYKGAKVTEGTDLAVGFTVPGTEGAIQFDALNSTLTVTYTCAETNSYLGVVSTRVYKSIDAKVEPCETGNGENLNHVEQVETGRAGDAPQTP